MCKADVYRALIAQGYSYAESTVQDYVMYLVEQFDIEVSHLRSSIPQQKVFRKKLEHFDTLSRNKIFKYLWMNSKLEPQHLSYVLGNYEIVKFLSDFIQDFRKLFELKKVEQLHIFIKSYCNCKYKSIANFVKGLVKDIEAVENAVSSHLSNGFVEGFNNRLKTVK